MKDDEKALLLAVRALQDRTAQSCVRDVIERLGLPWKRANYILRKWVGKDWYDYGVSTDLGWLEAPGIAAADRIAETAP